MIDHPATEVTHAGLTHRCMDPECHVPGFIISLHDAVDLLDGYADTQPPRLTLVTDTKDQ